MNRALIESGLWLVLAAGLVMCIRAATVSLDATPVASPVAAPAVHVDRTPYPLDSLAHAVVMRDLFRLGRRPSAARYDPTRDPGSLPGAPIVSRPHLTLRGVMLSDTARALIEGLPGIDGSRVLRVGEALAGLRIAAISRTQVRVVGLDTVWVLTLRRQQ